jgi:hypothetical protein
LNSDKRGAARQFFVLEGQKDASPGQRPVHYPQPYNLVPTLPRGNAVFDAPASHAFDRLPVGCHIDQRIHPRVIPGAGMPPVSRITDVPALDGIIVDIFELLSQYRLGLDHFRLASFLPELKGTVGFVPRFVLFQAL